MNAIRLCALWVAAWLSLLEAASIQAGPIGRAVAWGYNASGQATVPASLGQVVAVAAGGYHSLALTTNGTVVAWGDNTYHQTNVPAGASNVIGIAAGGYYSLALKSDGTVAAWGDNSVGEIAVPADLTNAIAIAAGYYHSLALRSNGVVAAWGYNNRGQTSVPAGLSNVVAIAGGGYHSLALKRDGTLVAWGFNDSGQATIPAGLTNVAAIAAGGRHNLALTKKSTVVAWGNNDFNQATVPVGLSNIVAVAAGLYHSLALQGNGTVVAWGYNVYGQCTVPGDLTNVVMIAGGGSHSLSITLNLLTILSQPPPSISLNFGDSTNLAISVLPGSPFTSQWFLNGAPIPGAIGTNLVITNFSTAMAGGYTIVASNQYAVFTAVTGVRLTNSPMVLLDGIDVGGGPVTRVDASQVTMNSTLPNAAIYYTLDGTPPDFTGFAYTGPFLLTNSAVIRAVAYNFTYTYSLQAVPINLQIWPTYALSITNPGGGTVSLSPPPYSGGNRYLSNTVVTLTATAQATNGWSFLGWSGDIAATTNIITVQMTNPFALDAVFGGLLTFYTNGNGQILLDQPRGPYAFGTNVTMTGSPAPGSYFFGWAGIASGFANPLLFNVTNLGTITALFAPLKPGQVWLMLSPNGNGTVSASPAQNIYTNGATVSLIATPGTNSVFSNWSGDASGTMNPLQLTLHTNLVIMANFVSGTPTNLPTFTRQPLSRTLSPGSDTTLSVELTGDSPFFYQWRLNGSPIAGATDADLTLTNLSSDQAGLYDVVVTGVAGNSTSDTATVTLFGIQLAPGSTPFLPLLVLQGAAGTSYQIEYSLDLSQTNWNPLALVTLQSNQLFYPDDPVTTHTLRFYRAVPQ